MSPVVKFLRIALPVIFLLFIGVIVVSFSGGHGRKAVRSSQAVSVKPRAPGDKARTVAEAFEDTQTIGGRVALKIKARRLVMFQSGWYRLEDVHLIVYRRNGGTYEIASGEAQVRAETKEAEAIGGVRVTSSDGLSLETDSIRFNGRQIANRIPVRFKVDQWSGRAGGLNLDVASETLSLNDTVEADLQPSKPTDPPMHLKSKTATFNRASGDVNFDSEVVMTRNSDVVRAAKVHATLAPGLKSVASLQGAGGVDIDLRENPAAGAAAAGATHISAERFFTESYGISTIDALTFVSDSRPTVATMAGPPPKTLSAHQLRVVLENRQIKEVQADRDVVFVENDTLPRRVTTKTAVLHFDLALRKPNNVYLQDDIHYSDGKVDATGDRANYEFPTKKLVLSALPGRQPTLKSDTETLRATILEVYAGQNLLKANGAVFAELKQKGSTPGGGLFPEKDPVFVNADNAFFNRAEKLGQFNGNVRAWQGTNTLFTPQLQIVADAETLTATGGVRTSLSNAVRPAAAGAAAAPVLTRSDQLVARRKERRIDLEGKTHIDDNGRVLDSDKATVFLDARQKIDRVEANGHITLTERVSGRKGTGEHAVYHFAQKSVTLDGNPASMADPKGTIRGHQIVFDIARNKVDVISGASPTEATYNPQ